MRSKTSKNEGNIRVELAGPVRADKLTKGQFVHYGGAMCQIHRIEPAKGYKDSLIIEFRNHPERNSFTTVAKKDDIFHTKEIHRTVNETHVSAWNLSSPEDAPEAVEEVKETDAGDAEDLLSFLEEEEDPAPTTIGGKRKGLRLGRKT